VLNSITKHADDGYLVSVCRCACVLADLVSAFEGGAHSDRHWLAYALCIS